MVATDLDGTIVRKDGTISARTLAALRACEAAGVDVVFVTGRPPRWMAPIAEITGHTGVAICLNGGIVYDLRSQRVLATETIPAVTVLEIIDRLRERYPRMRFAVESAAGFGCEEDYPRRVSPGLDPKATEETDLAVLAGGGVVKVLGKLPADAGVTAEDITAAARELLVGLGEPVHSDPQTLLLEIGPQGVSKATALARLAARRGIEAGDVVAFGDMPNDVPMLAWAGCGYAVADGHAEAIEAAACLAPPCAEDGVAQVLERLLAQG